MVSNLSVCVSVGLALCQPNVMSEGDITQQKHYSQVDNSQIEELVKDILAPTYSRELPSLETLEYVQGYYQYKEEQERLEQERIAEEQRRVEEELRRLEEEQKRQEQERQYQQWLNSFDRQGYRQTVYAITEGETKLGSGLYYGHPNVKIINNVMHYNDAEYGWIPIYAININEVMNSGQNSRGIWNLYGSIIEVKQGDKTWLGYVGDACGECSRSNKIDLWVYDTDLNLDISGVDWRYIRKGW